MSENAKFINTDRLIDSFIKLAKIDSGSNEQIAEEQIPSTDCQKNIANFLKDELFNIGFFDANVDNNYIVTATLESNIDNTTKTIGLLAHYDTNSDVKNSNVTPIIHNYKSGDIELKDSVVIKEKDLKTYRNQNIITSDGTTLLGADDKAGIAEILEALRVFKENPDLKHPKIRIAFTPDEETGLGILKFDTKSFGADIAYTIDGDLPEVIEDESFNAFNPEITIKGKNVHCGYAKKGGMINSIEIGNWIISKLPQCQRAQTTEGYQGYFHVYAINGNVSETKLNLLVRDHNYKKALKRVEFLEKIIKTAQKKFKCEISIDKKERYHNMKDYIQKVPEVMEYAKKGIERTGLKPKTKAIRGGTDGSQLSEKGLPTPNLGAGGLNFHSQSEFLPVCNLKKCCENIINILQVWAENLSK